MVILIIMAIYYFWSEGKDDREDDEKGPRVDLKKATDRERSEPVDALVVEDHSSDDAVDVVEIRD